MGQGRFSLNREHRRKTAPRRAPDHCQPKAASPASNGSGKEAAVVAGPRECFRTAPIITLFIPGTPLKNHPPTEACMIHSKQHRGCRMQDPGTRSYRWWKTADFSHSARCVPPNGGWWATKSVQNSGALWRLLGPFLGHIMVRASKGSKRSRERACIGGRGHQRGP